MAFDQENYQDSKNQGGEGGDTNYGVHEGAIVVTPTSLNPSGTDKRHLVGLERALVREAGLEPARPKTQVPKTCVSAISPLPLEGR